MSKPSSNALEVTVTELSSKLKRTVEDTFGHVRVRGEISGYRGPHSSGHSYFSLKDDRARLEAVIWRGQASRLKHLPEEGLEVVASGKLTTYPGSSKYQIVIDQLEPAGAGALMALLEERRKKLTAEGLFADERKQLLPYMPKVIGVVTSPTGAVIQDILHRLNDRFPLHVIVWPVRVQGDTSGPEVANGVRQFNQLPKDGPLPRPDLIIVARGGGSLEDLWGFNDEIVVRAVADSLIPVISAVGHETDWTLIDHAADWRAPTPTAAAEKAVPVKSDLEAVLTDYGVRLRSSVNRYTENQKTALRSAGRGLTSPDMLLAMPRRRYDEASGRLGRALKSRVELASSQYGQISRRLTPQSLQRRIRLERDRMGPLLDRHISAMSTYFVRRRENYTGWARQVRPQRLIEQIGSSRNQLESTANRFAGQVEMNTDRRNDRVNRAWRLLQSLSYKGVLARGYAVVKDDQGIPVSGIGKIKTGAALEITMHDGNLSVISNSKTLKSGSEKSNKPQKTYKNKSQGSLF